MREQALTLTLSLKNVNSTAPRQESEFPGPGWQVATAGPWGLLLGSEVLGPGSKTQDRTRGRERQLHVPDRGRAASQWHKPREGSSSRSCPPHPVCPLREGREGGDPAEPRPQEPPPCAGRRVGPVHRGHSVSTGAPFESPHRSTWPLRNTCVGTRFCEPKYI